MAETDLTKFQNQLLVSFDTAPIGGKLAALIKDVVTAALSDQNQSIGDLTSTIIQLHDKLKTRDRSHADLMANNAKLSYENEKLTVKIAELENYNERDKLVISGLNVNFTSIANARNGESADNILDQVMALCNDNLQCTVLAYFHCSCITLTVVGW